LCIYHIKINLNKYWIIKHKWELLIKEMKDIINNKMFLTKNRIFLIRNIKHANKDVIIIITFNIVLFLFIYLSIIIQYYYNN